MSEQNKSIPRALLAQIVDQVFDGACEDTTPIEEIYAVIMDAAIQTDVSRPSAAIRNAALEPSLNGAANLALNALHECTPNKGAEKQVSDAIRALDSALRDIAYTKNLTATPQQFARHLQKTAEEALQSSPAPKQDKSRELLQNVVLAQELNYGDGVGLHLRMINLAQAIREHLGLKTPKCQAHHFLTQSLASKEGA